MVKVSVIIPVYGVAPFVGKCAESLFAQTIDDVEFIFVNDCSPDESRNVIINVLERFPGRKEQVTIIDHRQNRGLPSARNSGLEVAKGEYVFHCDGDDFMELDALDDLYCVANANNADIVWSDFFESYQDDEVYKKEPEFHNSAEAIKSMLSSSMKYNVWNKLVRRKLYVENSIAFPEGRSMGEDLTMIKLFAVADTVCYVPQAYYHYVRWNAGAMTQHWSDAKISSLKQNVSDLEAFMQNNCGAAFNCEIDYLKLWLKFQFLLSDGRDKMYDHWSQWFPDCNKSIMLLPNANNRIKILMYMASKGHWWYVWIHYWVIVRLYYGIVYR